MKLQSKLACGCLAAGVLLVGAFLGYRVILWRQIAQFQSLTAARRAEDVMER